MRKTTLLKSSVFVVVLLFALTAGSRPARSQLFVPEGCELYSWGSWNESNENGYCHYSAWTSSCGYCISWSCTDGQGSSNGTWCNY